MRKIVLSITLIGALGLIGYSAYQQLSNQQTSMLPAAVKQKVNVTIYSTKTCPYCIRAKALLDQKAVRYDEVIVNSQAIAQKVQKMTGGLTSVPQIFIAGKHIGGFSELQALEVSGDLNKLLLGIELEAN